MLYKIVYMFSGEFETHSNIEFRVDMCSTLVFLIFNLVVEWVGNFLATILLDKIVVA